MPNPIAEHAASVNSIMDQMSGKLIDTARPVEVPAPAEAAPTLVAAPVVEDAPVVETPAAAAPAAVVATPAQKKLSRGVEIQRRAEAATRRARAEAAKLRAQPAPVVERKAEVAVDTAQQAQIAAAQERLAGDIRLLKNDPLAFAKKHGLTGNDLAEFVKTGADPVKRQLENLESQHRTEVRQIREEFAQQIASVRDSLIQGQEAEAQRNFFTFVEESKSSNPDAFAAIGSGLVFSDKEVWDVANHLLETRKDLQDNYDEDKLLEAVEVEARRDPRWGRLQALTKKQAKTVSQTNVAAKARQTNASTTETVEVDTAPAPAAPRETNGRFAPGVPVSPFAKHAQHVDALIRTQRLF